MGAVGRIRREREAQRQKDLEDGLRTVTITQRRGQGIVVKGDLSLYRAAVAATLKKVREAREAEQREEQEILYGKPGAPDQTQGRVMVADVVPLHARPRE